MNLDLEKQTYFEVAKISSIIKYNYELDDITSDELYVRSSLNIDLQYYNQEGVEKKKKLQIPIEILKDSDMENMELQVQSVRFEIIEGQGITCNYTINLSFQKKEDEEAVPIPLIKPEIISDFEEVSLPRENVVVTTSKQSPSSFLDFFKDKAETYYKVKCVYVKKESELQGISEKYEVDIDDLYKGYDQDKGYVIFHVRPRNN